MQLQRSRQPFEAAAARLAAFAGIDDLVSVTLGAQSLREQCDPTLLRSESICSAQAVTEDEDRAAGGRLGSERDEQQPHAERAGAGKL